MVRAGAAWACVGAMIGASHAVTVELNGMFGTSHDGLPDDLGNFYATISVGSGSRVQTYKVHVDTGSIGLTLPAPSGTSLTSGTTSYSTSAVGGSPVQCHSPDCDSRFQSDESLRLGGHLALCEMKRPANEAFPNGFVICPREGTSEFTSTAGEGKGICRVGPNTQVVTPSSGPAVACADHLSCGAGCGCNEVVNVYNYDCGMDMAAFSATLSGQQLNEFCPESCDTCPGAASGGTAEAGTRFCQDNDAWSDDAGRQCAAYAVGTALHATCFNSPAFAACPVSCEACGDCCSADDGCYFYTQFVDGTAVTGQKYTNRVNLDPSTSLGTTAVIQVFDWASNDPQFDQETLADGSKVDGVLGLGFAVNHCNPGCTETMWDSFHTANSNTADLFALCLYGLHESTDLMLSGKSSWDIGAIDHNKYSGSIHYFGIPYEVEGRPNDYYITDTQFTSLNIGSCNGTSADPHCITAALTPSQMPELLMFDSGTSQIKLPLALYNAFANRFYNDLTPSYNKTNADGTNEFVLGGSIHLFQSRTADDYHTDTCIGPVSLDYNPDMQFIPLEFTINDVSGSPRTFVVPARSYLVKRRFVQGKEDPGENRRWLCSGIGLTPANFLGLSSRIIVLGTVFMSAHYTIFDRGSDRIGVAEISNCLSGLNMADYPCQLSLPLNANFGTCPRSGNLARGSNCQLACDAGFEIDPATAPYQPNCAPTGLVSAVSCVPAGSVCATDPCLHGSFCVPYADGTVYACCDDANDDPLNANQCRCPAGFTNGNADHTCSHAIDFCAARPCHGDSTCVNTATSYTCNCEAGFSGRLCDQEYNECDSSPCNAVSGGSTCTDEIDAYSCTCESGWNGENCALENVCLTSNNPCGSNSHCNTAPCPSGITPEACHQLVASAQVTCMCDNGYSSMNPNNPTSACALIDQCATGGSGGVPPCLNGAGCTNLNGVGYRCSCTSGFSGDTCEYDIDECVSRPCVHGNCVDAADSYTCENCGTWAGDNCEISSQVECAAGQFHTSPTECVSENYCTGVYPGRGYRTGSPEQNPCLNNGLCIQVLVPGTSIPRAPFYTCDCGTEFTGQRCERAASVDPCLPNPCGEGECWGRAGTYRCFCPDNSWQSETCTSTTPTVPPPMPPPVVPIRDFRIAMEDCQDRIALADGSDACAAINPAFAALHPDYTAGELHKLPRGHAKMWRCLIGVFLFSPQFSVLGVFLSAVRSAAAQPSGPSRLPS